MIGPAVWSPNNWQTMFTAVDFLGSSWNFPPFLIFDPRDPPGPGVGWVNFCIDFLDSSWHFPHFWFFDPPKIPTSTPLGWGVNCFTGLSAYGCQICSWSVQQFGRLILDRQCLQLAKKPQPFWCVAETGGSRSRMGEVLFTDADCRGKKTAAVLMCRRNWRLKWNNRRSRSAMWNKWNKYRLIDSCQTQSLTYSCLPLLPWVSERNCRECESVPETGTLT